MRAYCHAGDRSSLIPIGGEDAYGTHASIFAMPKALKIAIALVPWILASFVFYWLDSSGTWTAETPHRGKMSVMILGFGMLASLLLHTWLSNREGR